MARRFSCRLNGTPTELECDDRALLLDALRERGLTGTKPSCEMEICGACTVLIDGLPVSSCTTLALEAEGRSVTTIEGVAENGRLSAVQEAFIECFALQCGFCTPGMILTAEALLDETPAPSRQQVLHWMEGNICRCTGYEPIVQAVLSAAAKRRLA